MTAEGAAVEKMGRESASGPGRLNVTVVRAANICRRPNAPGSDALPSTRITLTLGGRTFTAAGTRKGRNVDFSGGTVAFDLSSPDECADRTLSVELVEGGDGNDGIVSMGTAALDVGGALGAAGSTVAATLNLLRKLDRTTNSTVDLTLTFCEARCGVLKLRLDCVRDDAGTDVHEGEEIVVTTSDGQRMSTTASSAGEPVSAWVDPTNWFGSFSVHLPNKKASGLLSVLDCLAGKEGEEETSHFDVISSAAKGKGRGRRVATVVAKSYFLEAGFVTVKALRASGLPGTGAVPRSMAGPRVVVSSRGRVHSMSTMSKAAATAVSASSGCANEVRWNDVVRLPVVDEYSITIEAIEYDECTAERESLGKGELSLLPLFKSGRIEATVPLKQLNDIGERDEGGTVFLEATFEGPPGGVAFPRDQPAVQSYVVGQANEVSPQPKVDPHTKDDGADTPSDESIKRAFTLFDLDKNGYIGVAELRHCLVCMGEVVSDEIIDEMIQMLDVNGDGQVSFREFRAMCRSPDPATDDFLSGATLHAHDETFESRGRTEQARRRREVLVRCVSASRLDKSDIYGIWDAERRRVRSLAPRVTNESFRVGYNGVVGLLPAALASRADCREVLKLLSDDGGGTCDSRDVIMGLSNFVGLEHKELCELAFELFDIDRSGFLSISEVESMLSSTNLLPRNLVRKRAENFMLCADTDRSGGITVDELIVGARKLRNLVFPPQT